MHLWCRGDRALTSVVVYVHGYWDTADSAFDGHQLAQQFAASQLDALFVVVEAPSGPKQDVVVSDLDVMIGELKLGELPQRTLLIGHSGGNRTLKQWLRSERARDVVLLDGLYGSTKEWTEWLSKNTDARFALVSQHTAPQAEKFMKTAPRAQVSNVAAGCSHMAIVKNGEWLVRELRAFGARGLVATGQSS